MKFVCVEQRAKIKIMANKRMTRIQGSLSEFLSFPVVRTCCSLPPLYLKVNKNCLCAVCHSVLLLKGPAASFHRERKERTLTPLRDEERQERQHRRGRREVRLKGKDCSVVSDQM